MDVTAVFALAFAIGMIDGLRSMTAPAVVSWAAHWKWLNLDGTALAFLNSPAAAYIFTALAASELVVDKLPQTPSRLLPGSLFIRIVLGGLCGAALCASTHHSPAVGAALGAVGAIAGAFAGYQARTRLARALNAPDFAIALLEDAVAVGCGFLIVSRF